MKTVAFILLAGLSLGAAATAQANPHHGHARAGTVIIVPPVPAHHRLVIRHESYTVHCRVERITYDHEKRHHATGAAIIAGGLTGALIGHGLAPTPHDRGPYTLLGTLVGASIGHDLAHQDHHHKARPHERYAYEKYCWRRWHAH